MATTTIHSGASTSGSTTGARDPTCCSSPGSGIPRGLGGAARRAVRPYHRRLRQPRRRPHSAVRRDVHRGRFGRCRRRRAARPWNRRGPCGGLLRRRCYRPGTHPPHPDLVRSLVLVGTFARSMPSSHGGHGFRWRPRRRRASALPESFYPWIYTPGARGRHGRQSSTRRWRSRFSRRRGDPGAPRCVLAYEASRLGRRSRFPRSCSAAAGHHRPAAARPGDRRGIPGAVFEVWAEEAHQPFQEVPSVQRRVARSGVGRSAYPPAGPGLCRLTINESERGGHAMMIDILAWMGALISCVSAFPAGPGAAQRSAGRGVLHHVLAGARQRHHLGRLGDARRAVRGRHSLPGQRSGRGADDRPVAWARRPAATAPSRTQSPIIPCDA